MGVTRETNHNSGVHPSIYGNLGSFRVATPVPHFAFPESSHPQLPWPALRYMTQLCFVSAAVRLQNGTALPTSYKCVFAPLLLQDWRLTATPNALSKYASSDCAAAC